MAKYFRYHDGGRAAAGYRGQSGDCVVRSIAIATGLPYQQIYDLVNRASARERTGTRKRGISNARTGVYKSTIKRVMDSLGWAWTPTMQIGSGCTVHLRPGELPSGRLVVSVSKHLTTVIDGVIYDTHDCSRRGKRCVYGYWQPPANGRTRPVIMQPQTIPATRTSRATPPKRVVRRKPAPQPPRQRSFFEWLFG